jgi:hypothetical protein
MKNQRLLRNSALTVAGCVLFFASCKKDALTPDEGTKAFNTAVEEVDSQKSSNDNSVAENTFADVNAIADQASLSNSLSTYRNADMGGILSACATVTRDSVNHTITVDFGTTNCLCHDGKNRRGKILINHNGAYWAVGSVKTITFDNYFVNDNQVTGTKTVTNMGRNSANNLYYNIDVNGSVILDNSAGTITWTSQRVREWTAGEGTWTWLDDTYSITGSGSGTNAAGGNFTVAITSALIKKFGQGCKHFVSGTIEFTPANKPTRTVDFGNGTCDDDATVTVNGVTHNITLH